ncbi:MAG: ral L-amino acid transport system permease protein [Betaproteobacteria bacterium]|nr:ral L-amino acid transport system permease protein [Betaproteobacteria bacterium]
MKKIFNLLLLVVALYLGWKFVDWAVLRAVWQPDPALCRASTGACWGFIVEKHRLIAFGTYPYEEHWRPALASILLVALWMLSAWRRFWKPRLILIWAAGLTAIGILMWGGVFGLPYVENERWGGLILTLLLTTFGLAFAFPLGILLALGRRSELPLVRALCVAYIELIRGVPLISVLFMASVMLPLFLPAGVSVDKLLRAQIALILFAAAYLAEVVRGGLQAIPKHQYETADALGLGYSQKTFLIVLPQALRIAVPPLVNTCIGFFKDTSLVLIIGLFDLLSTIKVALNDPAWTGFGVEAYLFAALVYFVFCFAMSRYSRSLESGAGTTATLR